MISQFRKMSESWIARVFFIIMAVSFVGWGISGEIVNFMAPASWVAKVGGETIEIPAFQSEFQRALAQQTSKLAAGTEAPPDLRREVGQQTLDRMIGQLALAQELTSLHVVAPDAAVADATRKLPAFRGPDGKFNKAVFDSTLQNNGYTEARFLSEMRTEITQQEVLGTIGGSVAAPDAEVKPLYDAEFEKRAADMAFFALSAAPEPAEPDAAAQQRWYENHPDLYATPEYRRIKAIELSPESLSNDVTITDDELRAAYNDHRSDYVTPETRSAQVISAPDEAKAQALATKWTEGADWAAMQQAAKDAGAAALTQDNAPRVEFPDPDLAKAVFDAPADVISQPIKGQLSWFVVKVTAITQGTTTTFEQARDALRQRALAAKAADLMYDRANRIDQLLGNGTTLDELPGDLGVAGVAGTLDANGDTESGVAAPIPGPAELRKAIIDAAFQAHQGDPPQLTEVQTPSTGGSAYYALTVEKIVPPGTRPFEAVAQQVIADWKDDQRRRFQDQAATAMMVAVQAGQSFSDAATVAGVTPRLSPLVTRNQPDPQIPAFLQRVMFGMKLNETTMVETPDAFVDGQLVQIQPPDAATDKVGYEQASTAITKSLSDDYTNVFIDAVRQRARPRINQQAVDSVVQAQ